MPAQYFVVFVLGFMAGVAVLGLLHSSGQVFDFGDALPADGLGQSSTVIYFFDAEVVESYNDTKESQREAEAFIGRLRTK